MTCAKVPIPGFSQIPNSIGHRSDITPCAKAVMLALPGWDQGKGVCWPSDATIGEKIDRKPGTVQLALRELERKELLERRKVPKTRENPTGRVIIQKFLVPPTSEAEGRPGGSSTGARTPRAGSSTGARTVRAPVDDEASLNIKEKKIAGPAGPASLGPPSVPAGEDGEAPVSLREAMARRNESPRADAPPPPAGVVTPPPAPARTRVSLTSAEDRTRAMAELLAHQAARAQCLAPPPAAGASIPTPVPVIPAVVPVSAGKPPPGKRPTPQRRHGSSVPLADVMSRLGLPPSLRAAREKKGPSPGCDFAVSPGPGRSSPNQEGVTC